MTREEEIKEFKRNMTDGSFFVSDEIILDIINTTIEWADEHPKNYWRDAEKEPPKNMKPVVGYDDGIIGVYEYSPEEKIWSIGMLISDAPEYWIPMPEMQKGE